MVMLAGLWISSMFVPVAGAGQRVGQWGHCSHFPVGLRLQKAVEPSKCQPKHVQFTYKLFGGSHVDVIGS